MQKLALTTVLTVALSVLLAIPVVGMALTGGWVILGPGVLGGRGILSSGAGVGVLALLGLLLVASVVVIVFFLTLGAPNTDDSLDALEDEAEQTKAA